MMSFYFAIFNPLGQWKKGGYSLPPLVGIRVPTYRLESGGAATIGLYLATEKENKAPRRKRRGIKCALQTAGFQPAYAPRGEELNPIEINDTVDFLIKELEATRKDAKRQPNTTLNNQIRSKER